MMIVIECNRPEEINHFVTQAVRAHHCAKKDEMPLPSELNIMVRAQ